MQQAGLAGKPGGPIREGMIILEGEMNCVASERLQRGQEQTVRQGRQGRQGRRSGCGGCSARGEAFGANQSEAARVGGEMGVCCAVREYRYF